jgi:DNA-binding SARP family transcriptional activator
MAFQIREPSKTIRVGTRASDSRDDQARPKLGKETSRTWAVEDVLDAMLTTTGFESVTVFLRPSPISGIDVAGFRGSCPRAFQSITHFEDGEGIPGLVAGGGYPASTHDVSHDDRFIRSQVKQLGFHSYICVPIPGRDVTMGCIEVGSRADSETLLKQWLTVTREAERLGLLLEREPTHAGAEADPDAQKRLNLRLLGGFEAQRGGTTLSIDSFERRRAVTLLKILLTNYGKVVVRDELVELLWPSEPPKDGAQLLKIVVHYLRRGLGEAESGKTEGSFISTEPNGYSFNTSAPHTFDAIEFEARAEEGFHYERQGRWREALVALQLAADLYAGDYLQDEPYSDWCVKRRRQLREKLFEVLLTKARLLRTTGNYEPAVRVYRRILDLDPCLEDVHRDLMEVLHNSGKRPQALRQFESCRRALREEFDVEPVLETESLYRRILAGNP